MSSFRNVYLSTQTVNSYRIRALIAFLPFTTSRQNNVLDGQVLTNVSDDNLEPNRRYQSQEFRYPQAFFDLQL